jgi:hypothetical protein
VKQVEVVDREPPGETPAARSGTALLSRLRVYAASTAATAPAHQRRTPRLERDPVRKSRRLTTVASRMNLKTTVR